ncbi:MAG TPA: hypothetical protein VJP77_03915 [Planctomycetota bacterium]|nr:hypothetical protein [Planctomycetota bacterium]
MSGVTDRSDWPIRIRRLRDPEPDDLAHLTAEERLALVWQLTLQDWALRLAARGETLDAEPPFHRHVVRVVRRGR